jgi:hypothetical protein
VDCGFAEYVSANGLGSGMVAVFLEEEQLITDVKTIIYRNRINTLFIYNLLIMLFRVYNDYHRLQSDADKTMDLTINHVYFIKENRNPVKTVTALNIIG